MRHGQASFGSADYDRLSELGRRQCVRLGEYLRVSGVAFEAALTGTLRRHGESLAGIVAGLQAEPPTSLWPALNGYDSQALIAAVQPGPLPAPDTPEALRQHFRWLREGLQQWMDGRSAIELNLRIRNSALTEFAYTSRRHAPLSFNTLPLGLPASSSRWAWASIRTFWSSSGSARSFDPARR